MSCSTVGPQNVNAVIYPSMANPVFSFTGNGSGVDVFVTGYIVAPVTMALYARFAGSTNNALPVINEVLPFRIDPAFLMGITPSHFSILTRYMADGSNFALRFTDGGGVTRIISQLNGFTSAQSALQYPKFCGFVKLLG